MPDFEDYGTHGVKVPIGTPDFEAGQVLKDNFKALSDAIDEISGGGGAVAEATLEDGDTMIVGINRVALASGSATIFFPDPSEHNDGDEITLINQSEPGTTVFLDSGSFGYDFVSQNLAYSSGSPGTGQCDSTTAVKVGSQWVSKTLTIAQDMSGGASANPSAYIALAYGVAIPTIANDNVQASLAGAGVAYHKDVGFLGQFNIDGVEAAPMNTGDLTFEPDAGYDYICKIVGTLYSSAAGATGVSLAPSSGVSAVATAELNGNDDGPIAGGRIIQGANGTHTLKSFQPPGSSADASVSYGFLIEVTQIPAGV